MILFYIAIGFLLGHNFYQLGLPLFIIICILNTFLLISKFKKFAPCFLIPILSGILVVSVPKIFVPVNDTYVGVVTSYGDNYYVLNTGIHRLYIVDKENEFQFGDIVKVSGTPSEVRFQSYESRFDFKKYLFQKGVEYGIKNKSSQDVKFLVPLRTRVLKEKFLSFFDDRTSSLIDAMLFSHSDYSSSIIENASILNVIFLFSMSGIYLSFLLNGVAKVIFYITQKKILGDIFSLVVFLPILIFIFPKISMIRVTYVYILKLINEHVFKKKFTSLHINSLAMISLMMVDYTLAMQQAFYMGFFISFSLTFLSEYFSRFKKKLYPFLLRVGIFVFMIPLSSYIGGSFHPLSFIFQFLLIPINITFISFTIISFYITPLSFLKLFGLIYDEILKALVKIDISLDMGDLGIIFIILFYVGIVYLVYLLENKRRVSAIFVLSSILTMFLISFIPIKNILFNAVYFINVGQGDSILIQNRSHAVLIDTGGNLSFDMAKEVLIPFFKKKQIYKLDAVITTHDDFDHSGAVSSLINNYRVGKYLSSREDFPYQVGDIYLENINTISSKDENDTSLVFNLNFMDKKFLLMGDASIDVEKYLIASDYDIDCDILKVGHHGSKTSTSDEFVKRCSPSEAVISVGYRNKYHHPNKEVIEVLEKYNVKIRRTDEEGTISYTRLAF